MMLPARCSSLSALLLASLFLSIGACSDDDTTEPSSNAADVSSESPDAGGDAATSDVAVADDAAGADAAPDVTPDAGPGADVVDSADVSVSGDTFEPDDAGVDTDAEGSGEGSGAGCDPGALAAETLGLNATAVPELDTLIAFPSEDDSTRFTIDAALGGAAAAPASSWLYLDLSTVALLDLSDEEAAANGEWDLAFKRAQIRVNSADSGPGSLMLLKLTDTTWETAALPGRGEGEWLTDEFVSDTCEVTTIGRGDAATAFGVWYDYDPSIHAVSAPEGVVYFLYDMTTHAIVKLQIESYESALYTLRAEAQGR